VDTVENLLVHTRVSFNSFETDLGLKTLTLNRLALVPIINPVWSKEVVHAVSLAGWPLLKSVPP
jgi:hypothetical protein